MTRYVRLLMSLAALAVVYWQLGGFEPGTIGIFPEADAPADSTTALADSVLGAFGGPDDGLESAELLTASGFVRTRPDFEGGAPETGWEAVTIGRNESFYVALQRAGLDHETIMALVGCAEEHTDLRKVQRGDVFELMRDPVDQHVQALRFDIDQARFVVAERADTSATFTAEVRNRPVQRVVKAAQGSIQTNLFDALKQGGAPVVLADQLAEVLGWEIDFFRDLRRDDGFVVVYAEYLSEGQNVRDPQVLAVSFVNAGREIRAYRHENDLGLPAYYKADGSSLERQFLRAPLKFTRISSSFSTRRLHPVLKSYRPHYGVDYAAPTGTPVMATADGVVIERTRDDASGNFVGLRHGNGYESFYLHLSRFAKNVRQGTRVRQGDVIGYVGATGWATGPHLDYRIRKNGKWIDPRRLALPPAPSVSAEGLAAFQERTAELDALLASVPVGASTLVLERSAASPTVTR